MSTTETVWARINTFIDTDGYNMQVWVDGKGIVYGERFATRELGRQAGNDWLDKSDEYRSLPRQ